VVYTYGCSRIGNPEFAEVFDTQLKQVYRFVHGRDTVTQMPPMSWGYKHVGLLIYCPNPDGLGCNAEPGKESPDTSGTDPADHAKYLGHNWLNFIAIGTGKGCKAPH